MGEIQLVLEKEHPLDDVFRLADDAFDQIRVAFRGVEDLFALEDLFQGLKLPLLVLNDPKI